MKKRTIPLLLLIAGVSATALAACGHEHKYEWKYSTDGDTHWQECECGDKKNEGAHVDADSNGKCDECGASLHVHAYEWASDATNHWQECECGDKKDAVAHVDVKNNETDADGEDDKCDVCGREATVKFNMLGHGVAPAKQYVALNGGSVTEPETPADDDCWKFKGWYKDDDCTQAFNFGADKIEAATTLYAKWEEDTTEGASKTHAFELEIGLENAQSVEKGKTLFFSFTAEKTYRYTATLGAGIPSQNSTFTTSLTGDTVYGKDQDAESVNFDLKAGETVYVLLTYQGENGEDLVASPLLIETTDEPLPADYFIDGEYAGGTYSLEIDREAGTVSYNENSYEFSYVGGAVDMLYFEMLGGMAQMQMYHNEDGTYRLVQRQENWMGELEFNELGTLSFVPPQAPVALSALEGYYEPEDGAVGGINKLYIYASESTESATVRYEQNGYYSNAEATYNTEKNELSWSGKYYSVTLNLAEDNTIESINVTYGKNKGTYVRKGDAGDAVPESLPLDSSKEYIGESTVIRTNAYGGCYFGATGYNAITITSYVKATDTYTVSVSVSGASTTYKLTVSSDKETITLYAEDGTTLVDTLTLFKYVYHDLPTTETEVSLSANDFQKNLVYLFKVKETGWYTFSGLQDGVRIYYNLNETDPLTDYTYEGTLAGADAVSLTEDSIVGVFMETPAATSFTVAPAETPEGWGEDNPKLLVDNAATVSGITANAVLYFEFTAPAAGGYLIQVYYNDGTNSGDTVISYTVNGKSYSYGYSDTDTFTEISATQANQKFKINVTVSSYIGNKKSVTVVAGENYAEGATDVTLTGTPADDSLTLSAQIDTGVNYHLTDTHETDVTATADAAFTVKLQGGTTVAATESNGKFVAAIPAATEYFTVASETAQKVTLSQTFAHGEIGYPIEASATEGSNTLTVEQSETVYFMLPAGEYSIAASTAQNVTLGKGDTTLTFGAVFTVEEGDVLSCVNYNRGDGSTVTLTITEAVAVFTADQVGTFTGTTSDYFNTPLTVTFSFNVYGIGTYVVDGVGSSNTYNVSIAKNDSHYQFEDDGYSVTFTFTDGGLSVTDNNFEKTYAMSKVVSTTYTWTDTNLNVTYTLTVNGDFTKGQYAAIYEDATYSYDVTFTSTENGYEGKYDEGGTECTLTVVVGSDNTITMSDSNMFYNYVEKVFTKQA